MITLSLSSSGEIPSAVKADLWTVIGIDSKVRSFRTDDIQVGKLTDSTSNPRLPLRPQNSFGMRSTLFTPKDLVIKENLDELKKDWQEENKVGEGGKARVKAKAAAPVLNDDDFEDDSEEEEKAGGKASGSGSNGKAAVSGVKKKREEDSATEDEGESRKKAK